MEDHVVVITGASSGIGEAVAKLLVKRGANVILAARSVDKLMAVAEQCGHPDHVLVQKCDVMVRADHEALLQAALEKFGKVTCWINNAGVGISKSILELTDDDVDMMVSANIKSVLYGMQIVVPYFKSQNRGHVINVSSMLGRIPYVTFRSVYCASKAAMNSLTTTMRLELARDGFKDIHCALYIPGVVATDFGLNALHGGVDNRKIPGAQDVEEVAEQIADMVAEPAKCVEVYSRPMYKTSVINYYSAEDVRVAETGPPFIMPAHK